jgi:hypothetical protein
MGVLVLGGHLCKRLLSQTPPPPPTDESSGQPGQPASQTPVGGEANPEVLTRGPIHEAFAEVVSYNPQPGQVVAKEPPKPIEEVPPAEKPAGDYTWIPGYWAWDHDRDNFIWVTGAWRIPPPGQTWVPGYWNPSASGYQWVGGYWGPAATTSAGPAQPASDTVYLPPPPQSVESGASTAAPSPDLFWVPGYWYWADGRYVWRAGYWARARENWVWIPARYVWTPGGYVFLAGHWDFALAKRGVVFCPVYYANPYYVGPGYYYSPSVCIEAPVLTAYLFCRPAYGYYFGDYYDPIYLRVGIFPWYMAHERGFAYDPLFVYGRWYYGQRDPGWVIGLHHAYDYRVAHFDARPPHTYEASLRVGATVGGVRFSLAVPIARVAVGGGPMHFERISNERRGEFVRAQHEMRQAQAERRTAELRAGAQARANGGQPVHMNVHTGTVNTARTNGTARPGTSPAKSTARTAANTRARPQSNKKNNR